MGRGVLTAGGRLLRHSDKGVFHVFMTVGILFQCYSACTYCTGPPGHFYVQAIFLFPCQSSSFYGLLCVSSVKYFCIPKCVLAGYIFSRTVVFNCKLVYFFNQLQNFN